MKGNFETLINSQVPVLVDFSAEWCGPCKAQAPILKQLAGEMGDRVKIVQIDVDRNPAVASQYQIQGAPTLMLFKEGKLRYRQSGVHSKTQLMSILLQNS
jgi:thioredoxin 1